MKAYFYLLFNIAFVAAIAQTNDSIVLDEILVTGQVVPTHVNKTVYPVQVITEERIKQSAANTLADLLNQSLNIQVLPDNQTGKSNISMFGLDSEYVKVLVDNIPLINDEGLGNFTDFSQINLDNIQQIEIVEGAMGVDYGADAAAGIINIITKKNFKNLKASVFVQEESVGDEYAIRDRGRHIKGLHVHSKLYKKLSGSLSFNNNDFDGWFNDRKGKNYYGSDDLRGHEFMPKKQYDLKSTLNYKLNRGNIFYTFNFYKDVLYNYNHSFDLNYNPTFNLSNPFAQDRRSPTTRWVHHLNFNTKLNNGLSTNLSLSYQSQDKDVEDYTYYILTGDIVNQKRRTYESKEVYYAKALFGKEIIPSVLSVQLSSEVNLVNGIQSSIARSVDSSIKDKERELGSYDVFSSSTIHMGDKFSVRPGMRALFSSQFKTAFAYSVSANYTFNNNWESRLLYGTAPKLPNFEQLYTYFVDSNHFIVGNENLKPETSHSLFIHTIYKSNNKRFKSNLSGWYIHVDDQIDLITTSVEPLEYKYQNFETYNNTGISFSNELDFNRLSIGFGFNFSGESYESISNDMLFSWNGNLGINYSLPKHRISLATQIKRNGKEFRWILNPESEEIEKKVRDSYYWMDLSLKKKLYNNWNIVVGVRNLLDVTTLDNSTQQPQAHMTSSSSESFAYGRSFFGKLTYNIPFS